MTDRERLIRLMQEASQSKSDYAGNIGLGQIADYLLANGVIVPPCGRGTRLRNIWIYGIYRKRYRQNRLFLTREEAEKALKIYQK